MPWTVTVDPPVGSQGVDLVGQGVGGGVTTTHRPLRPQRGREVDAVDHSWRHHHGRMPEPSGELTVVVTTEQHAHVRPLDRLGEGRGVLKHERLLRRGIQGDRRMVHAASHGPKSSNLMVDKVTTMPRVNLREHLGRLPEADLVRLNRALIVFLGLVS